MPSFPMPYILRKWAGPDNCINGNLLSPCSVHGLFIEYNFENRILTFAE